MCNAHNHQPSCTCGWGGSGAGGGRRFSSSVRKIPFTDGRDWKRANSPSFRTFTVPNAKCPVCGATVFFYQSSNGGRVFFDCLGPPWPKHGCTDSYFRSSQVRIIPPADLVDEQIIAPECLGTGWSAFIATAESDFFQETVMFGYEAQTQTQYEFVLPHGTNINLESPIFFREIREKPGNYEISFLRNGKNYADILPEIAVAFIRH